MKTFVFKPAKDIPFYVDLIPESAIIRPGLLPETKKHIVIHNTGNYPKHCDAAWHNEYIHNQAVSAKPREASWHFTVDGKSIWQHIPVEESAWHAGDGGRGRGNLYGIGIEICVHGFPGVYTGAEYDEWEQGFLPALDNAAALTASLAEFYGISTDADGILQHYDCAPEKKNCPMQMRYDKENGVFSRENGTLYNLFLRKVEDLLKL